MDAVEFLKTKNRMCRQEGGCRACPYGNMVSCNAYNDKEIEEIVRKAEQWTKEYPVKTRQSEFLKMFPNASLDGGVINIFPCVVDNSIWEECDKHVRCKECSDCSQNYWLQEVE